MTNPTDYGRSCFVMMPYGSKPVGARNVNFDRIYDLILVPAIQLVEMGGKAMVPLRGDRQLDARPLILSMKQHLLRSRLVLAELSSHNTNVGFELGMRFLAVPCGSVLVHLKGTPIPFDLAHEYVLAYMNVPQKNVERAIEEIAKVMRATLDTCKPDNPGYQAAAQLADQMGDPLHPTPLGNKIVDAISAASAGQPEQAAHAYGEAVALEPKNTTLHQIYGMSLVRAGRIGDAEEQFRTVLQLDPGLTNPRRVLADLKTGQTPALIDRRPLTSAGINSLGVENLIEAMKPADETFVKVMSEKRPEGLMSHVAVIGGSELNPRQIVSAVGNLGVVNEYPALYYPESNRTVWSFDVHAPHTMGVASIVEGLKQSFTTLPGPKRFDVGGGSSRGGGSGSGGGGSFGGAGGMGGIF